MTYRELMKALSDLDETQLDCDIEVGVGRGFWYSGKEAELIIEGDDMPDAGHPIIYIKDKK